MIITELYNKSLLREHPDADPVADSSFEKSHSFIFPGDELVMCTVLDCPTDLHGGDFVGVTLQGVRMSIVARKLDIFDETFGIEFASTREFELDSFFTLFNNTNAPNVLWGADGYAPNINFSQDRAWALPSGDFRRQIKGFTQHTPSTNSWKYNFWFPIIFREDYWNSLAAADNDFYNITLPQNGKNQKWFGYHQPAFPPFGWKIFYKFEFQYQKVSFSGTNIYKIVSEIDLSNELAEIQDYNSNPDYSLKSIKTCPVGGTPSNTPACFVFGSQNTSCFGYFTKQTAWDIGEKNNLTAVFRIRPFEGGDRLGSRGSSIWPSTPDVVWTQNSTDLQDENGISILDENSNILEDEGSSPPITITLDPMNDLNIIVSGEIDYTKLAIIYPGINNFTLYCRLYNSTPLVL